MKKNLCVVGMAAAVFAAAGGAFAGDCDDLGQAVNAAKKILAETSHLSQPASADPEPAPGMKIGKYGLFGRVVRLGKSLGRYKFVYNAVVSGRGHPGTTVVMRRDSNDFEVFECTLDLREEVVMFGRKELVLPAGLQIYDRSSAAVAVIAYDSRANLGVNSWLNVKWFSEFRNSESIKTAAAANPDQAMYLLGEYTGDHDFYRSKALSATALSLYKHGRDADAERFLRDCVAGITSYSSLHLMETFRDLFDYLVANRDTDSAMRIYRAIADLGSPQLDDEFWALHAKWYLGRGEMDKALQFLKNYRYPPKGSYILGEVEKIKYGIIETMTNAGRYEAARAVAAGMSDDFNGADLTGPDGEFESAIPEYKSMAYRAILTALVLGGRAQEAAAIFREEWPATNTLQGCRIYDEVYRLLQRAGAIAPASK